jgi:hypothetical protein
MAQYVERVLQVGRVGTGDLYAPAVGRMSERK